MRTGIHVECILKHWGLADTVATPIDAPHLSTWDIGGRYILKHSANADELARSLRLTRLLAGEGAPVATYIPTTDGQMTTPDGQNCLMSKLPGIYIDLYKQPELAFVLGRELAQLHMALARIEPKVTICHDNDLIAEWRDYIKPGLDGAVSDERIARIEARLYALYPKLPRQLIHRDVHLHNVLFENGRLTGWLDFDLGRRDVRIFDLVYLLSSFLQPGDLARVSVWRTLCIDVLAGYDELQPLTSYERNAFPALTLVHALLFVSFWGCQNNLEKRGLALHAFEWLFSEYSW